MGMASPAFRLLDDPQHNRILRISFPNDDGPESQFLVNTLDAAEYVVRDSLRLFVQRAGMRLVAAAGDIDISSSVRASSASN